MSKSRKSAGGTLYLVERKAYRAWDYEGLHYSPCESDEGESYSPVAAFDSQEAAESHRAALENEARSSLSPALFASYSVPEDLPKRIKALGLGPLKLSKKAHDHGTEFRKWWVEHAEELTLEQTAALWELFGDVELYRVIEMKLQG